MVTLIDAHHWSGWGHDWKSVWGVAEGGGQRGVGGGRKRRAEGLLWRYMRGGGTWGTWGAGRTFWSVGHKMEYEVMIQYYRALVHL